MFPPSPRKRAEDVLAGRRCLRIFLKLCHGNLRWQKALREALRHRRRKLRPFLVFNKRELLLRLHLLRLLQLLHLLHALRLSSGERRTLWSRESAQSRHRAAEAHHGVSLGRQVRGQRRVLPVEVAPVGFGLPPLLPAPQTMTIKTAPMTKHGHQNAGGEHPPVPRESSAHSSATVLVGRVTPQSLSYAVSKSEPLPAWPSSWKSWLTP